MIQVRRIGYTTLETPDVDRQIDYYTQILGLNLVGRDNGRAFLASKQGQQAVVLERGDNARCTRLGFQVAPDTDLKDVAKALAKDGIKSELRNSSTPGSGSILTFEDPKGTTLEIFAEEKMLPVRKSTSCVRLRRALRLLARAAFATLTPSGWRSPLVSWRASVDCVL